MVVMAQAMSEISRQPEQYATEQFFGEIESPVEEAINQLHQWFP